MKKQIKDLTGNIFGRYKYDGARGKYVYNEWKDNFENFYVWAMANGYAKELALNLIDKTKNYTPENCE